MELVGQRLKSREASVKIVVITLVLHLNLCSLMQFNVRVAVQNIHVLQTAVERVPGAAAQMSRIRVALARRAIA